MARYRSGVAVAITALLVPLIMTVGPVAVAAADEPAPVTTTTDWLFPTATADGSRWDDPSQIMQRDGQVATQAYGTGLITARGWPGVAVPDDAVVDRVDIRLHLETDIQMSVHLYQTVPTYVNCVDHTDPNYAKSFTPVLPPAMTDYVISYTSQDCRMNLDNIRSGFFDVYMIRNNSFSYFKVDDISVRYTYTYTPHTPPAPPTGPSPTTNVTPANTTNGVMVVCGPSPDYSCDAGGYSGETTGWPEDFYGGSQASTNAFGSHNCTLYAAYRLKNTNGVTTSPGWYADAKQWAQKAYAAGTPVDQSPTVGSIAQWNGGAFGHVAYVDVVTSSYIEITDDAYSDNVTHRYRIDRLSPAMPDNFIHFTT